MKIYVSSATIKYVSERPYYNEAKTVSFKDIIFEDSTRLVNDWIWRKAGNTPEEEDDWYDNELLPAFRLAKIYEGSRVTLISNENRDVLAICSIDRKNVGWWIDGRDLKAKKFYELGIVVSQMVIE